MHATSFHKGEISISCLDLFLNGLKVAQKRGNPNDLTIKTINEPERLN